MTRKTKSPGNEISRRRILRTGAAAAAALSFPSIMTARADEDVLFINTWGGTWQTAAKKNLFDPFTEETGIRIRTVSPVSYAKLTAQVRTGNYEFDVTTLGLVALAQANAAELVEPVDGSPLDTSKLWPGAVILNGVSSHAFTNGIAYRNDKFQNGGPANWAEFWNTDKFKGTRSLQRYPARILAMALLADGVAPADLFPYDLDRAFASLDRLKSAVRVWWTQGPQSQRLLRDGEVELIDIWNTQIHPIVNDNVSVTYVWNQAIMDKALWVVAKGTPRAQNAWKFVEFAVQAKQIAGFSQSEKNGPLNPEAIKYVDPQIAKTMPTYPDNLKNVVVLDPIKLGPQIGEMTNRFEKWLLT